MNPDYINLIVNDKSYMSFCKKLIRCSQLANDLYQEFILEILENSNEYRKRFIRYDEFQKFCYGIIVNKYRNRNRNNSPLSITSGDSEYKFFDTVEPNEPHEEIPIDIKNIDLDPLELSILIAATETKNMKTFCHKAGISYNNTRYKLTSLRSKIKENAGKPINREK